jgi:acyl-CoA dehydrogenase
MSSFVLTEEQTMLRDTARSFLSENAPVAHLRQLRDSRDEIGFSRPLWQRFAEMGFTGVLIPESHGGMGLGHAEAGLVMEEIGRHLSVSPLLASGIVAATALRLAGSEAQQQVWLPALAAGERLATLAVDEHSKHRPLHVALTATPSGEGYLLDGAKTFVLDGHVADLLVVAARTSGTAGDAQGLTLFAVERYTPGIHIERTAMVDAHNAARIRFEQVQVPASALLGEVGHGSRPLQAALNAGRVAAAAELLGLADEAFTRTVAYLKERRQFGRVIGEFQALQHRAALLYCEIEITRSAVMKAQRALDEKADNAAALVAIAKARAGTTATLAVQEGVQLHGGMGMTDEFEMGFFMKRARVLQELFGDATFHANQLALLKSY